MCFYDSEKILHKSVIYILITLWIIEKHNLSIANSIEISENIQETAFLFFKKQYFLFMNGLKR